MLDWLPHIEPRDLIYGVVAVSVTAAAIALFIRAIVHSAVAVVETSQARAAFKMIHGEEPVGFDVSITRAHPVFQGFCGNSSR